MSATPFDPPGRHKDVAAFREHWRRVDPAMACDLELRGAAGPLGWPLAHAGRRIGNRLAIQPMEGWDGTPDGGPSAWTRRRWRNFGRSGAKLIWGGEAFAVRADGRANLHQLYANPERDTVADLVALLAEVRGGHREAGFATDDLWIGLQLTHSGRYSCGPGGPAPRLACRHPLLDARAGVLPHHPLLSDGELESIAEDYVIVAQAAQRAGFDFVDVKCCHGYLLHELLSARDRPGKYGGSLAGRSRLLLSTVAAIRRACPGLEVGVRLSVFDAIPHVAGRDGVGEPEHWPDENYHHGFGVEPSDPTRPDFAEPLEVLRQLSTAGVRMVNVTAGSPYYSPHVQRPAWHPPSDGYLPPHDPLVDVAAQIAATRVVKQAVPELVVVGSGYSYLQEYLPHVAQHEVGHYHVDFVGAGRMVLSYPQWAADVLAGRPLDRRRICRTLSDCTTAPRHGLPSGCYPLDPDYRARPEAAELREIKRRPL